MNRVIFILLDVIISSIFIIPIGIIVQQVFFRQRILKKKLVYILFSLYLVAIFSAVGIPDIRSLTVDLSFNFIPIIDIMSSPGHYIINEMLNIIMFIPLGFFLPIIWNEEFNSLKRTTIFSFGLSCIIEILQIFTFRLTDIDDLITNTIGAIIGYYIALYIIKKIPLNISSSKEKISSKVEIGILLTYVFAVMFFILPNIMLLIFAKFF